MENNTHTIRAFTLNQDGDAMARIMDEGDEQHGRICVCSDMLPGEEAHVRIPDLESRMPIAETITRTVTSPNRTQPFCPVYDQCGGCTMQHIQADAGAELKQQQLSDCLTRIGGMPAEQLEKIMQPIVKAEEDKTTGYRNHMQYQIHRDDQSGRLAFGLYAEKSHRTVLMSRCAIAHPVADLIKDEVEKYINAPEGRNVRDKLSRHTRLIVRIGTRTSQALCRLLVPLPKNKNNLMAFPALDQKIRARLQKDASTFTLCEKEIVEKIGKQEYIISPESFFQVNTDQAEKLYDIAQDLFSALPSDGPKTILDIYCGTGSIGLHLSDSASRLIGLESNPKAIEDARRNATRNHVQNAEFHIGRAEYFDFSSLDSTPDVVILDPPRKGCDSKLLTRLAELAPPHIIYISCDPATLARDLSRLTAQGYQAEHVQAIDMFPWTGHVETVALMSRANK